MQPKIGNTEKMNKQFLASTVSLPDLTPDNAAEGVWMDGWCRKTRVEYIYGIKKVLRVLINKQVIFHHLLFDHVYFSLPV